MSRIYLDATAISVVVKCTACPHWFGFALDKHEAWQVGARHQQNVHPGNDQAARSGRYLKRKKDYPQA